MNFVPRILLILCCAAFYCDCAAARGGADADADAAERNRAALARAEQNIQTYRRGDAVVRLAGFPQKNLRLKIRQISHDFKFGCYLKIDGLTAAETALYEQYFKRLFNYAVVGTYWDVTENEAGAYFWDNFDAEIRFARRNGWRVQTAPLLWGTNRAGTPRWLPESKPELQKTVERRIGDYFDKYREAATDVEVVNEPLAPHADVFADRLGSGYIDAALRQARRAAPQNRLMINEYGVFGAAAAGNDYNDEKYYALLAELERRNVPFDIIGIQAHAVREWFSPADVAAKLDRYARLGKPLQISEFSAQTKNYDDRATAEQITGAYRSGSWNDERQAEFYREFYTVAFGNPHVEAIVQWGLDDARAWLPGIGLIDEAGEPKANFRVLDELINRRWRTNLDLSVGAAQKAEFRGFFGVYEIEVSANGAVLQKIVVELKKNLPNEFTITNKNVR